MQSYSDGVFYAINTHPNPFLISAVESLTPGIAMDVGSGMGPNAKWLFDNGWTVHVVEQEEMALSHLAQIFPPEFIHQGNALQITLDPLLKFDLLTCNYMLQHLLIDDAATLVQRMVDRMSPGGVQVYSLFEFPGAISFLELSKIMKASGAELLATKKWSVEDANHGPKHHHAITECAWKCRRG